MKSSGSLIGILKLTGIVSGYLAGLFIAPSIGGMTGSLLYSFLLPPLLILILIWKNKNPDPKTKHKVTSLKVTFYTSSIFGMSVLLLLLLREDNGGSWPLALMPFSEFLAVLLPLATYRVSNFIFEMKTSRENQSELHR